MPTVVVVFDTNLYRQLTPSRFAAIREREVSQRVEAVASYTVATELLSHLADSADADFKPAAGALFRLWNHCKTYNGSQFITNLIALPHELLAHHIFEVAPLTTLEGAQEYGSTIGEIVNTPDTWTENPALVRTVEILSRFVVESEDQFVKDIWDMLVRVMPGAEKWSDVSRPSRLRSQFLAEMDAGRGLPLAARLIVRSVARTLGLDLTPATEAGYSEALQATYSFPVHFWDRMIHRVVETGVDMSQPKRRNSTWDFQVSFSTGKGARLYGVAPVWLITGDSELLSAGTAAGMRWNVRSPKEYEDILALPCDEFREYVDSDPSR